MDCRQRDSNETDGKSSSNSPFYGGKVQAVGKVQLDTQFAFIKDNQGAHIFLLLKISFFIIGPTIKHGFQQYYFVFTESRQELTKMQNVIFKT